MLSVEFNGIVETMERAYARLKHTFLLVWSLIHIGIQCDME